MNYLSLFKMPKPMKITGRSSTITNAFINSIIPVVEPTEAQVIKALAILNMTHDNFQCSYCGDSSSEWDHLRPLVKDKKPTGFISEIHNLVPSCGKCNQSKGNKYWKDWIVSSAKLSPKSKGIADLGDRINRLDAYENWEEPTCVDFESIVEVENWDKHWKNCEEVQIAMRSAQILADEINTRVRNSYK